MSEKIQEIVDKIKELTLVEASELKTALEEEFGVSAAAPVVMAAAGGVAPEAEEEKTEFDVILSSFGEKKINVIKVVRSHTGLGLKEAKELVDNAPKPVKEAVSKEEAEKVLKELSLTLGEVELEETYYVLKDVNVLRDDGTPENKKEFRKLALKNTSKIDEDGYFIAEVGTWVL